MSVLQDWENYIHSGGQANSGLFKKPVLQQLIEAGFPGLTEALRDSQFASSFQKHMDPRVLSKLSLKSNPALFSKILRSFPDSFPTDSEKTLNLFCQALESNRPDPDSIASLIRILIAHLRTSEFLPVEFLEVFFSYSRLVIPNLSKPELESLEKIAPKQYQDLSESLPLSIDEFRRLIRKFSLSSPVLQDFASTMRVWLVNEEFLVASFMGFLLQYHGRLPMSYRALSSMQKEESGLKVLLSHLNKIPLSQLKEQIPEEFHVDQKTLVEQSEFLVQFSRKNFLRDFMLAIGLTYGFCLFFEPQNTVYWIVACIVFNILEAVFAFLYPHWLFTFYKFRLKAPLVISRLPLAYFFIIRDSPEVKSLNHSYAGKLIRLLCDDPWFCYQMN